ncbi:MAG: hypothetical protein JXQ89_23260 [Pelagimonas sp.]
MARQRKSAEAQSPEAAADQPVLSDDLRRFITHAADLIDVFQRLEKRLGDLDVKLLESLVRVSGLVEKTRALAKSGRTVTPDPEIGTLEKHLIDGLAQQADRIETLRGQFLIASFGLALLGGAAGGALALYIGTIL